VRPDPKRPGRRVTGGKRSHEVVVDLFLAHQLATDRRFNSFVSFHAIEFKRLSANITDTITVLCSVRLKSLTLNGYVLS
jgi:hypothetical protein